MERDDSPRSADLLARAREIAKERKIEERRCTLCNGEGTEFYRIDIPGEPDETSCRVCGGYGMIFVRPRGMPSFGVEDLLKDPPGSSPLVGT